MDRPSKVFICGICHGFIVPQAVGRTPLSEIPAHIREKHSNPSGGPTTVSLSWSDDPALIDHYLTEQSLEEVYGCSKGCGGLFANVDSLATHWAHEHYLTPTSADVQAALDRDPDQFNADLLEVFNKLDETQHTAEVSEDELEDGYPVHHCPNIPRIKSRPGEDIVYIEKQLSRTRDDEFEELFGQDSDPSISENAGAEWPEGHQQIAKLELRFCNIIDGYIPIVKSIRRILPYLGRLRTINVSWQNDPTDWFPCKVSESKRAIYNLEGRLKRVFQGIPSGTLLYVIRVDERHYRLELRAKPHTVPNCKFFVRNNAGGWNIEIHPSHVEWECGDDLFRHQLTFEEIEAIHAEARRTNLSVRDAVHETMERYARNSPRHIREVYEIVFLLRTCSLAAVWAQFRPEHECYERVAPCIYTFNPNGSFPEVRYIRSVPRLTDEPSLPPRSEIQEPLLLALVRVGGSIVFSTQGRDLEIALAAEFGLSDAVRDFAAPHYNSQGHRKWRNHLQFVKDDLVNVGQIDSSVRDTWRVTDQGYRRIGLNPR